MMLSPSTVIRIGTGARPGNVMVHPDVVAVAVITEFVGVVSPLTGTARTFHLPATSARLIGAGAAAGAPAVSDAIVSTAASSFLAHPARTMTERQTAKLVERRSANMEPPVSGYAQRSPGSLPSPANVRLTCIGGKRHCRWGAATCCGRPSARSGARW